jgi:hypothetical protein
MIIHQQVDVGHKGRQRDLVKENAERNRGVDGDHQPPGMLSKRA